MVKFLFFSKYKINEKAEIVNIKTNSLITPTSNHGYLVVRLYLDNKICKTVGLHRLMASTFLGKPEDVKNYEADHIDNNRINNNVSNIQWLTHKENTMKSGALRRKPKQTKVKIPRKRYSEEYKKSISKRMKGRKLSDVWKENISKGHKGKHYGGKECVYDGIVFQSKSLAYEYACKNGYTKSYVSFRREY